MKVHASHAPTGRWLITLRGSKRVFVVYSKTPAGVRRKFREAWPTLGLPGLEEDAPKTMEEALAVANVWI